MKTNRFDGLDGAIAFDEDTVRILETECLGLLFDPDAPQSDSGDESAIAAGEDQVDAVGATVGVTYEENETLACGYKERKRDLDRWELDPASADDYRERMHEERMSRPRMPGIHH
jgi:hypothetical protein